MTLYKDGRLCSIEGCHRRAAARNWCATHYSRWRLHGDPLIVKNIVGDLVARFWSHVNKNGPGGCWLWTGTLLKETGYPVLTVEGKSVRAHRFAYELLVGPIASGLTIDHTCHTRNLASCAGGPSCIHRRCVNPAHLEAVPGAINSRRAVRDRCKYGHPFDEANTYWAPKTGRRQCRACWPAAKARQQQRKAAA